MTAPNETIPSSLQSHASPPSPDSRSGKFFLGVVLGAVLCAVCFFGAGFGGAIGVILYTMHSENKATAANTQKLPDVDKPIEKEEKKMEEPILKAYKSEDSYKDLFKSSSGMSDLMKSITPIKPRTSPLKAGDESAKNQDGNETDSATDAHGSKSSESPEPSLLPSVWVNAHSKINQGDVEIAISRVYIGAFEIGKDEAGKLKMSNDAKLQIRVTVANVNPKKKLDFQSWQEGMLLNESTLVDNLDNSYNQISIASDTTDPYANLNFTKKSLYPNKPITDDLIFETPLETATFLHLELPAENIGGSGKIRFEIPADMITK